MVDGSLESSPPPKRRKARPSRGRGLRTNTGCLTCRQRRLKCDEGKPECGQCTKSSRDCVYSQDQLEHHQSDATSTLTTNVPLVGERTHTNNSPPETSLGHVEHTSFRLPPIRSNSFSEAASSNLPLQQHPAQSPQTGADITSPIQPASEFSFSPVTQTSSFTPGAAPYEWYDLLAQDAVKNIDNYNFLTSSGSRWSFEQNRQIRNGHQSSASTAHHRAPSSEQSPTFSRPPLVQDNTSSQHSESVKEPWNTSEPACLGETELRYFQFFIEIVGPVMDLFDLTKHFTNHLPHLALRNTGLLKSLLALSARYKGYLASGNADDLPQVRSPTSPASQVLQDEEMGIQYYYETLNYLSHAMQYPSYTRSSEIVATALLISCYEGVGSESSMDWERHLKGVFWIQRSQDNNGERQGLTGAIWWHWLRQDIWAALKHGRKTLTIWKPTKPLSSLTPQELACRALYLQAKAVSYASDEARQTSDLGQRIEEGDILLHALQDWHRHLPRAFKPLPGLQNARSKSIFPPLWIHPPIFAAAMQAYSSAKILVLLNKPSMGGVSAYHDSQKMLNEAVKMICGIAQAPNSIELPLALVNVQALSIAGQCIRTKEQQDALAEILNQTLDVTKFPSKSAIEDLRGVWMNTG